MRFNPHAFKRAETAYGPDAGSTDDPPVPLGNLPSGATTSAGTPESSLSPSLAAFIAAYGRPGANQVTIPEGSLAVTLSLKFNDSAAQGRGVKP